eukprot:GHRR01019941.1.p1 GENE.GHRR01019941.1~~GHRR01019941.1.p1  ORF type:complete len:160 (+),score=53.29 GHRR01019941.1:62-481(+)
MYAAHCMPGTLKLGGPTAWNIAAAQAQPCQSRVQVSVISVGLDKCVFTWDIRQDTPVRVIPDAHLHEITCCAVNRRGNLIATGGADCAVKLWDLKTGRLAGTYAGHTSTVNKLHFSPDDNQLASVANDGTMVLWSMQQG